MVQKNGYGLRRHIIRSPSDGSVFRRLRVSEQAASLINCGAVKFIGMVATTNEQAIGGKWPGRGPARLGSGQVACTDTTDRVTHKNGTSAKLWPATAPTTWQRAPMSCPLMPINFNDARTASAAAADTAAVLQSTQRDNQ